MHFDAGVPIEAAVEDGVGFAMGGVGAGCGGDVPGVDGVFAGDVAEGGFEIGVGELGEGAMAGFAIELHAGFSWRRSGEAGGEGVEAPFCDEPIDEAGGGADDGEEVVGVGGAPGEDGHVSGGGENSS